jgi:peptidoglycan DL-endopeptidase CwlO
LIRAFVVFALVLGIGLSTAVTAGPGGSLGPAAYATPDDPNTIPSQDEVDEADQRSADAAAEAGRIEAKLAAANAQLRQLDRRFQTSVEVYNQARYELQEADRAAHAAEAGAASARRTVEERRQAVGAFAARTYQQGSAGLSALLSADGPQELIDRAALVKQVSNAAAVDYQRLQASRTVAVVLDRQAAAARESRQEKAAAAEAARQQAEQALVEQDRAVAEVERQKEEQLARLAALRQTSVELARQRQEGLEELARERAEAQRKAAAEAAAAAGEQVGDYEPDLGSGQAAKAVRFALDQVGEPYVFGAAGPGSWDCSGLTMQAWARAGIRLPHFARGQYRQSQPTSLGRLRPGDLLFWANNPPNPNTIYHVALYLGDGRMVHAPRPGRDVEIQSMWYMGAPTHYARPR